MCLLVDLLLITASLGFIKCDFVPSINWDHNNYLFKKQDGCEDEHYNLNVRSGDYLSFVCPSMVLSNTYLPNIQERNMLYENMYVVTQEEFENCKIDELTPSTRKILSCDSGLNPNSIKYELFYIYSAVPVHKLSFHKGRTYHFIATSNGTKEGLDSLEGGRCKTHNMRMTVYICDDNVECKQKKCRKPLLPLVQTSKASTLEATTPTITTKKLTTTSVVPEVNPRMEASYKREEEKFFTNPKMLIVICLFCGIAAGIFIGVAVVLLAQRHYRNKNPAAKGHEVFTMERQEDNNETLLREANRQYFSGENPEYRHSTEFKRLLSTSSGRSSERYSAAPVVQFT